MAPLFRRPGDFGPIRHPPLVKKHRTYYILAIGAALVLACSLYVDVRAPGSGVPGLLLRGLSLLLVLGAIVYGFKLEQEAKRSTLKYKELLLEAKQRTTEIMALYDTSQDVSGQHHLSSLLQIIVGRAMSLLATPGCALFLYDAERNDFEITVEVGVGMPVGTHIPLHEGLGGRVAETLAPVIVNDYRNWPYRSRALGSLPIGATVCVPMIRGGELIGVLGVHESGDTQREFTDAEARLLSLFADNAASAVYNARLLDQLQHSKERFRIAAECASDIVYDWDLASGTVEYFGASSDRVRSRSLSLPTTRKEYWEMIHPEDRDRVKEALAARMKDGRPFSDEYRVVDRHGAYIIISDRSTAIRNSNGDAVRLIGAVSNITERKQAEQMKTDFVSFVTHQLRTPLSGVKWMLELVTDSLDNPEEARAFIRDAQLSTDRLIDLVNDLLDVSRLERGTLQIDSREVDLAELTRSVIDELNPLMLEKEQSLVFEPPGERIPVTADPQLLRQVILNLLSNAMKYTPRGGDIRIGMEKRGQVLNWEIQDSGIGIPKTDMKMLFEKFYRAGNARTVETEGTGLGLYLVRLIVEKQGGCVECESEEGRGSVFKFCLPLAGPMNDPGPLGMAGNSMGDQHEGALDRG